MRMVALLILCDRAISYPLTWPDLLGLLKEKTRESLKGGASQLPLLVAGMMVYAVLVLVVVKLL